MTLKLRTLAATTALLLASLAIEPAVAQKPGGILRMYHWDSPPSMSIHEEVTIATDLPMMGVFNNLVLFDQHVVRNSLAVDRAGARYFVVVERGRNAIDVPPAPGGQMA